MKETVKQISDLVRSWTIPNLEWTMIGENGSPYQESR